MREGRYAPQTPNRCSTGCDSSHDCYPEGNFDRNQLPAMVRPGVPRRVRLSIAVPASHEDPPVFSLWTSAPAKMHAGALRCGSDLTESESSPAAC